MFENEDEIKIALQEYLKVARQVRNLITAKEAEPNTSAYSEQEFEELRSLLSKEKEAKKKFFTLLFEKLKVNWSQEEIEKWMEDNI